MGILKSVELPIQARSKVLLNFDNIGQLRAAYRSLDILKYVYLDPKDGKLKATNPPNDIPVVENAYITIQGDSEELKPFIKDATEE